MKPMRDAFAAGLGVSALLAACSGLGGSSTNANGRVSLGTNQGVQVDLGTVNASLDIGTPPNGATVTSLDWTITNGTNTYTGTTTVGDAQSFEFVQGGIAASPPDYTITLSGSDSNGDPCTGTSPAFAVTSGAITQVVLAIVCTTPPDGSNVTTGSVDIDASITLQPGGTIPCPGISAFSISPAGLAPGQSAALTLGTIGPAATIAWTVSPADGGTFGDTSAVATSFTCSNLEPQVTITATVGLPDSGLCTGQEFATLAAMVNCEGAAAP